MYSATLLETAAEQKHARASHPQPSTEVPRVQQLDPIQTIIDEHKRRVGYYRMGGHRRVLIPHKVFLGDLFGDQSHMTINRDVYISPPTSDPPSTMQLSDWNQNQSYLRDVESVNLLSSLVIRAIQIHRRHLRLIPGSLSTDANGSSDFANALFISQMQVHRSNNGLQTSFEPPKKLPPIGPPRPSSAQTSRMKTHAFGRAARIGERATRILPLVSLLLLVVPLNATRLHFRDQYSQSTGHGRFIVSIAQRRARTRETHGRTAERSRSRSKSSDACVASRIL